MAVVETASQYSKVVKPLIDATECSEKRLKWVWNILDKEKETERIIFEDPDPEIGFILHADSKWDISRVEDIHCIALPQKRGIQCLRCLNHSHLPLLHNILEKGQQVLSEKFGILGPRLRIYVHYHPTFYYLHVHFTLSDEGAGAGRAHLLSDIIHNIEWSGDHYQTRALTCILPVNHFVYLALNPPINE